MRRAEGLAMLPENRKLRNLVGRGRDLVGRV
jgi:hypothetical protein